MSVSKDSKRSVPRVVLLIESSRVSGRAMLSGVANYVRHRGAWSFFWEPGGLEKALPLLKTLDADGIILRDVNMLDRVLALGIPAVVVGHMRKEVPGQVNVVTDSPKIGMLAADHLLRCGFKQFAYCGLSSSSMDHTPWSESRRESFARHISEAGYPLPEFYRLSLASRNLPKERAALAQWLESLPKPVGIMACNDDCGQRVIEACKLAALPVPDLVGVIGADNDEVVCGLSHPAMSSVAINFERAGYEAAEALGLLMRGEHGVPSKIAVGATHVVARPSTDLVSVRDMNVAKALRYIRDHVREPMSVSMVASAAGLSRRALERRFRSEVNASILDEIRRARTDQIARLLVETTLPVNRIADLLGFPDVQHFARYFRATKKMSPLAHRRKNSVQPSG